MHLPPLLCAGGGGYGPASDRAVQAGQLLLLSLGFDGSGGYLPPGPPSEDRKVAQFLAEQLAAYNMDVPVGRSHLPLREQWLLCH